MDSQQNIPVADLRMYVEGSEQSRRQFAEIIGNALRDYGFFALTNHGIDSDLIASAYRATETFFRLPDEVKSKYEIPGMKGQRGFTSFGKEHAKDSQAPDLKEFWHVGREVGVANMDGSMTRNVWPEEVASFKDTMIDLYSRLETCSFSLLEACAIYLGEVAERFTSIAEGGNSILRIIHYPPVEGDAHPASIRAAAHEDINLITLLCESTAAGLEILDRSGKWVPIHSLEGQIIVDSGDMLQNISNGVFKSTTHRVVNPDNSKDRRFSMPFFVHPRSEAKLDPLPSCIERAGAVAYPAITAGQYLEKRLAEIGLT